MTVENWEPSNERQHAPFTAGNEVSVTHGARSLRRVEPLARELVDAVLADPATAYLRPAQWLPALEAWARAEAQVALLEAYIAKAAERTGDGVGNLSKRRVTAAYDYLHRAETRAASGRARLGLDPLSRAKLNSDVTSATVDLAKLFADGGESA